MAAFVIDAKAITSDNNSVTTSGVDTTGADFLAVCVASNGGSNNTPTDSKGNTWTPCTRQAAFSRACRWWFCQGAISVGANHTFSQSESGTFMSIAMVAFSGTSGSPLDQQNTNGGEVDITTTASGSGSVTPTSDGQLILNASTIEDNGTGVSSGTLDSPYTSQGSVATSGKEGLTYGYYVQPTAGATNPNWTFNLTNHVCVTAVATFKASGASGGGASRGATSSLTTLGCGM